ncbi:hypothetical protein KDD30_08455 [Photobacterium sp. GJ3]|uniref:hypothetical protein n=1 Tax=Photobacterium sp. GJ3 TaxID=2829502 RepID=UPI001B8D3647|nr:hypothetical protein [Photobacterium sp. GJ3]QUJ66225.1 hypothetical protein KDD30_08455 [Photobacterium sp. GJ3]
MKSEMIAQGWTVVPQAEDETSMDDEYPEITCGSGSMAICSVGFQNAEGSVAFVIEHSGHEIVVSGEY